MSGQFQEYEILDILGGIPGVSDIDLFVDSGSDFLPLHSVVSYIVDGLEVGGANEGLDHEHDHSDVPEEMSNQDHKGDFNPDAPEKPVLDIPLGLSALFEPLHLHAPGMLKRAS